MGAATETDLRRYLTFPRFAPGARRALARMIERGRGGRVAVEGERRPLVRARARPAGARAARGGRRAARGTTLLSPFDSFLWHRERVARLFGFDYRIEVYTPGAQRVHGYYSLPILHDGQLIGRLDAKTHRAERRLEVRHVHFEPWFAAGAAAAARRRLDHDAALAGLAEALGSLATFVGGRARRPRPRHAAALRAPLKRAVAAAVSDASSGAAPRSARG